MWKLICANTLLMLRSKRLWIGAAALIAYDLGIMNFTMSGPQGPGLAGLEARVFGFLGLAALLVPVVTVLFVNTDYHDGTIRSKLAVGHSRAAVYLANLLVSAFAGLFYFALHLLVALPVGYAGGGAFMLDPWELAVRMGASVLVLLSMTAVTVAVSMLMAHRAVTVVVIIMMALLLDGASLLENCLAQPQEVRDVVGTVEVVNHEGETVLRYVDREGREQYPDFQLAEYGQKHFGMYSGQEMKVTLRGRRDKAHLVWDRFGQDVILVPDGEEHFTVTLPVVMSPQFFGWLLGLDGSVTLIGPRQAVRAYRRRLAAAMDELPLPRCEH